MIRAFTRSLWLSAVITSAITGCAAYQGSAASAESSLPAREPGWVWVSGLPEVLQRGDKDCGAAALTAVLGYWGQRTTPEQIRTALGHAPSEGLQAGELTTYARKRGFDSYVFKGEVADLLSELRAGRPVIVGVAKQYGRDLLAHYEVVIGVHPASQMVLTLDPAHGWRKNSLAGFMTEWQPTGRVAIVVLLPPPAG